MPSHLRRYDEPGHVHFWTISCFRRLTFFWEDGMKGIVVAGLRLLQEKYGVCLVGYVVMPEHVHVLLYPHQRRHDQPWPISKLLQAFKQHVGYHGQQRMLQLHGCHHKLWSEPLNKWFLGEYGQRSIWNVRGYDFNIDRHETLVEKLDYCHRNPMTRELVALVENWPWSSYRFYELQDRSLLSMNWDGSWPIQW